MPLLHRVLLSSFFSPSDSLFSFLHLLNNWLSTPHTLTVQKTEPGGESLCTSVSPAPLGEDARGRGRGRGRGEDAHFGSGKETPSRARARCFSCTHGVVRMCFESISPDSPIFPRIGGFAFSSLLHTQTHPKAFPLFSLVSSVFPWQSIRATGPGTAPLQSSIARQHRWTRLPQATQVSPTHPSRRRLHWIPAFLHKERLAGQHRVACRRRP